MRCDMETSTNTWKEIFKNVIPQDSYVASLNVRDTDFGNFVYLCGKNYKVTLRFSVQFECRQISRSFYMDKLISDDQCEQFKEDNFKNVIYTVDNSDFIRDFEYRGFEKEGERGFVHYIIVAENSVIDILAFGSNVIKVLSFDESNISIQKIDDGTYL